MTLTAVPVEAFPGLNLNPDTRQVGFGGAAESYNVDPAHPEMLKPRDGTTPLVTLADYRVTGIGQIGDQLIAQWRGATPKIRAYNAAGAQIGTTNALTGGFATIGTPAARFIYFGDTSLGLKRWDPDLLTFSTAGTAFHPWLVATSPNDNRLVMARSALEPYTVWFSDPGAPESFPANNYLYLDPGDGEAITNLVVWRDQLFVFKRTKFYVFYGTSTDGVGEPIFNYRRVDTGVGATGTYSLTEYNASATAVAAKDGVYFLADDGMYVTTGDRPQKISEPLDAWFNDSTTSTLVPTWTGDFSGGAVAADSRYVYFCPESEGSPTFVYSLDTQQWAVSSLTVLAGAASKVAQSTFKTLIGTSTYLLLAGSQYTTDNGAAITTTYKSGDDSLGSSEPKTIRKATVRGSGTPTLSVFVDSATSDAGAAALASLTAESTQSYSRHGTYFAHQFSGSAFTVTSLAHYIREQRLAGL